MRRQQLLQRCRVVAALKPFEKLATQTDRLSTFSPSLISTLQRIALREHRDHNLFAVETLVNDTIQEVEKALEEAAVSANGTSALGGGDDDANVTTATDVSTVAKRFHVQANAAFVTEACGVLRAVIPGLRNLQQTYANDSSIQTRLETLRNLVEARTESLEGVAALLQPPPPPKMKVKESKGSGGGDFAP